MKIKGDRFTIALLSVGILSFVLRFWQLGQFNELVFDEVYYAKFAHNYLVGQPFFHSHPPLAQYLIALGMKLGSFFPAPPDQMNALSGSLRSTFSYRWLNAFTGSFIPLVVGAIAYQLTHRQRYGLMAAFLASLDGLFLVESRYALNNIYLILFGLLGQLFILKYIQDKSPKIWQLILAGIFFGMTLSIKWNGLGFFLGIGLFLLGLRLKEWYFDVKFNPQLFPHVLFPYKRLNLTTRYTNLWLLFSIVLGVMLLTYSLLWIPHLMMNPEYNFIEIHQQILSFHERVGGNNKETHPYCSPWYSWLFMIRPIAYYYKVYPSASGKIIYDVHAMGNPLLWWSSTLAMLLLISVWLQRAFLGQFRLYPVGYSTPIILYLVMNYSANLLPWLSVHRCTFLYHYMASYVFSWLALGWIIDHWLSSPLDDYRWLGRGILVLIVLAFIFWLPIYLGIPLSEPQFKLRLWFNSWI